MKIYTLTYDDARPTKQQVNIPTNSDYKIGIKVIGSKDAGKIVKALAAGTMVDATILAEAFNLYPQQVTLVGDDGSTISADPELTNGYVTFTLKAGDEANFTKYKVQVKNDTFDGIQYSTAEEGTTGNRVKTIATSLSCDAPTTIYPSDKILDVEKDGKMYPYYGNVVYYYNVKNSAGQVITDSSYLVVSNSIKEISPKDGIRYGVVRNNWVYNSSQTGGRYDIAPKYTDEMIADGDTLNISFYRSLKGYYYIQFAVIPYENTFDLAVNIFKSQQGNVDAVSDTSSFYTKGEVDEMLNTKADESDVFSREQLSAMFEPLKDTSTGAAKSIANILSGDVVSSLYSVAVELFGEPPAQE